MMKKEELRAKRKRAQRQALLRWMLLIAGIAVVITGLVIFRTQASIGNIIVPQFLDYSLAAGTGLGDPDAPVRIEEYSDFQCSACAYFHETTLSQLIDTYVATGQVYITFRAFPILDQGGGTESHDAANAAYCAADQDRFWQFHDMLFSNRIGEGVGSFTLPRLEAMGKRLGLDPSFNECVREIHYADLVLTDRTAAFDAGFNSTPSFLINGQPLVGAQPFEVFAEVIDLALQQTQTSSP